MPAQTQTLHYIPLLQEPDDELLDTLFTDSMFFEDCGLDMINNLLEPKDDVVSHSKQSPDIITPPPLFSRVVSQEDKQAACDMFTAPPVFFSRPVSQQDKQEVGKESATSVHRFRLCEQWKWDNHVNALIEFRQIHAHCNVPHVYTPNPSLGSWTKRMRRQYKLLQNGKVSSLTPERLATLNDLGFVWDSQTRAWENNFRSLSQFQKEHGHCEVPSTYQPDPSLANWVKVQRRNFKKFITGKQSTLSLPRISLLKSIGFTWRIRTNRTVSSCRTK